MPLVLVSHRSGVLDPTTLVRISRSLQVIVAGALNVEENKQARLFPEDIEVRVQESSVFDQNHKDLEIVVFANQYPERLANLDERTQKIKDELRYSMRNSITFPFSGYVWVLLTPGSFCEL